MKLQSAQRRERLAAALRENLRRRKAAAKITDGQPRGRGKEAAVGQSKVGPEAATKER
jgi:hypothetical protein